MQHRMFSDDRRVSWAAMSSVGQSCATAKYEGVATKKVLLVAFQLIHFKIKVCKYVQMTNHRNSGATA